MVCQLGVKAVRVKLIESVMYWWEKGDDILSIMKPYHSEFIQNSIARLTKYCEKDNEWKFNVYRACACFVCEGLNIGKCIKSHAVRFDREVVVPLMAKRLVKCKWFILYSCLFTFIRCRESSIYKCDQVIKHICPSNYLLEVCDTATNDTIHGYLERFGSFSIEYHLFF